MGLPVGTPQSVILEQLDWFAQDVMPAFKGRVTDARRRLDEGSPEGHCTKNPSAGV